MSTNQQDDEGHTPLFLALCEGHQGCANRLLHAGSSLQAVTKVGRERECVRVCVCCVCEWEVWLHSYIDTHTQGWIDRHISTYK